MVDLNTFLPIMLYIFGIILIIVLIILGIKVIQVVDKVDRIMDNIEDKVNSLNGIFDVINKTTNRIDLISTKVVTTIASTIGKLFKRKEREESYYE